MFGHVDPEVLGTQSGHGSSSRGCSSLENSHLSSGSETSSMCKHRKGRAPVLAVSVQSTSGQMSARIEKPTASHATLSSMDESDSPSDSKGSEEGVLQKEAYQHVMSYIRKIVEWEKDSKRIAAKDEPAKREVLEPEVTTSATPTCLEVLVSLRKGTVVETSPSTRELLGYPSDMWVGRSFIDYVYPKDRAAFTRSISSMGVDTDGRLSGKDGATSCELYCRLRHYRGLRSVGFNVVSRAHIYKPFQMRIIFREKELNGESPCILVVAEVLHTAYKLTPEGLDLSFRDIVFTIRHTASCRVDQYDKQGIGLLGHLPQDLIGHSIVDLFHPEDLPAIKDVYRRVTQRIGVPFRSRPYRLRAHNGHYVNLETDWSCFINPWSNHIEAVICLHRVLQPPDNINVFEEDEDRTNDSVEMVMLSNSHRIDIENILSKSVTAMDPQMSSSSQRRKRLVMLMEHLITELETVDQPATPEHDHTSVPGDVSPHTSERGSPAPVSVTPPNYLQLNYKETMDRFFQSHPKTMHGSSDESDVHGSTTGPDAPSSSRGPVLSVGRQPGGSGLQQQQQQVPAIGSCHAHPQLQPQASYQHRPLTQAVLDRHNADMEKNMRQTHGTKKAHDSKCKFGKRKDKSCCPEQKKEAVEFDLERRRVMNNTPAWPEPSVFWPPFSVCHSGANAPPQMGYGYWVVDQTAAVPAAKLIQPSLVMQPLSNPLGLGPRPAASRSQPPQSQPQPTSSATSSAAVPTPAQPAPASAGGQYLVCPTVFASVPAGAPAAEPAADADDAARRSPVVYVVPVPITVPTTAPQPALARQEEDDASRQLCKQSLKKMNLDSDEDMSSKGKQDSEISIGDSSISSLPKDVDASGDSLSASWLDGSDVPKGDSELGDEVEPHMEASAAKPRRPVLKDPPWLENVVLTSDLTNRYQLEPRNMEEVLERDRQALRHMPQSATLTEQLNQLYHDLENTGAPSVINLEEKDATSSSSDDSAAVLGKRLKRSRRVREYDRLTIVYEEDAPLPPPELLHTFQPLLQVPTSL